jgi:hypothetical protein
MTPHHIILYSLVEEKNEIYYLEIYPCQDKRPRRRMSETPASMEDHYEPQLYEIRLKGHLDARWANRFEGLTITLAEDGDTLLTGPVIDQAALHGLLKKVRDLGLSLVSIRPLEYGQADAPDVK